MEEDKRRKRERQRERETQTSISERYFDKCQTLILYVFRVYSGILKLDTF